MLLVDVHEFDVVLRHAVTLRGLENEVHYIRRIFSFEGKDIVILCATEDLLCISNATFVMDLV